VSYEITEGCRLSTRPSNLVPAGLLQDAAPARELHEVRPPITPWGNAMRLQLDHEAEVSRILAEAYVGADRRQAVRS
jgi:hypothetical protein